MAKAGTPYYIGKTNVYVAECLGEDNKIHIIKFTKYPPSFERICEITENANSNSFTPVDYRISFHGPCRCLRRPAEWAYVSDDDIGRVKSIYRDWALPDSAVKFDKAINERESNP